MQTVSLSGQSFALGYKRSFRDRNFTLYLPVRRPPYHGEMGRAPSNLHRHWRSARWQLPDAVLRQSDHRAYRNALRGSI